MKRLAIAFACLLAGASCQRAAAPPPAAKKAPTPPPGTAFLTHSSKFENDNLLNLIFGAAVIDRTNEVNYEASAAHTLDGLTMSSWTAAPRGKLAGVFSLAAPTRLRRLGLTLPPATANVTATFRAETSLDGRTWTPAVNQTFPLNSPDARFFDVDADARYLRIALDTAAPVPSIQSLYAIGSETAPFVQPPIEGCWQINDEPARFEQRGARVTGTIGNKRIDGGTDGRVYRLTWLEGAMWGYAAVTVSADGNHISGVRWHEAVIPAYSGDGWIGRRVPCADGTLADPVEPIFRRTSFWRLYGLRFDRQGRLMATDSAEVLDLVAKLIADRPKQRFRIVAREYFKSEEQNRARGQAKLDAMREALRARSADLSRIDFASLGSPRHELAVDFTSQRVMDTALELQLASPR